MLKQHCCNGTDKNDVPEVKEKKNTHTPTIEDLQLWKYDNYNKNQLSIALCPIIQINLLNITSPSLLRSLSLCFPFHSNKIYVALFWLIFLQAKEKWNRS